MKSDLPKYLESVFRNSNSPDEIFDAVDLAVKKKVRDIELYKILIANPSLSKDELIMFTEKICRDFPESAFELYMWLAEIFESKTTDYNWLESAVYYYQKAFITNPVDDAPLLSALKLYNYDFDVSLNKNILQLINNGMKTLGNRKRIYTSLSEHYGKVGNNELKRKYAALAEKESRKDN